MHYYYDGITSAILLVRNPFRAIVAEWNRRRAGKTGWATDARFQGEGKILSSSVIYIGGSRGGGGGRQASAPLNMIDYVFHNPTLYQNALK